MKFQENGMYRIYTDFSCSFKEWETIDNKEFFIHQLKCKLQKKDLFQEVKRTDYFDFYKTEDLKDLIKCFIKEITNYNTEITLGCNTTVLGYILIEFPEYKKTMPNIIVEEDRIMSHVVLMLTDVMNTVFKMIESRYKVDNKLTKFKGSTLNSNYDYYMYFGEYDLRGKATIPPSGHYYPTKNRITNKNNTQICYSCIGLESVYFDMIKN